VNQKTFVKGALVVSKLGSRSEGCGFESHPILDGNSFKSVPGSIPILVISSKEKKLNGTHQKNILKSYSQKMTLFLFDMFFRLGLET
jgi:hypothetical protein